MRREEAVAVTSVAAPEPGRDGEQPRPPAGLGCGARGEPGGGGPQESCKQRKKFLYSEPHKRIKEVLEEELYIKRDECHIKNPPAEPVIQTDFRPPLLPILTKEETSKKWPVLLILCLEGKYKVWMQNASTKLLLWNSAYMYNFPSG